MSERGSKRGNGGWVLRSAFKRRRTSDLNQRTVEVQQTTSNADGTQNQTIIVCSRPMLRLLPFLHELFPSNDESATSTDATPSINQPVTSAPQSHSSVQASSSASIICTNPVSSSTISDVSSSTSLNNNIPTSTAVSCSSSLNLVNAEPSSTTSVNRSRSVNENDAQIPAESIKVEGVSSSQISDANLPCSSSCKDSSYESESKQVTTSQIDDRPSCSFDRAGCDDADQSTIPDSKDGSDSVKDEKPVVTGASDKCDTSVNKLKDKGEEKKENECPVCLHPCVHPAKLPCSHVFCYLCLKGIALSGQSCPMCRASIPFHYANHPQLVPTQESSSDTSEEADEQEKPCWFYQGRHGGWWQFEQRMSNEIEENHSSGSTCFDMMICGSLYVIDTIACLQYPKYCPMKTRRLLRDLPSRVNKKGVAGIHSNNVTSKPSRLN